MTEGIDARLGRYGSVVGTVVEPGGGPSVTVTVYSGASQVSIRSVNTDATGRFELLGLSTGSYRLRFSDPSGRFVTRWLDGELTWETRRTWRFVSVSRRKPPR